MLRAGRACHLASVQPARHVGKVCVGDKLVWVEVGVAAFFTGVTELSR